MAEPVTKGQPPNNGKEARPHCVLIRRFHCIHIRLNLWPRLVIWWSQHHVCGKHSATPRAPVFEHICNNHQTCCLTSVNIWQDSVVYDDLTINERKKNDNAFSSILEWWSHTANVRMCRYMHKFCRAERVIVSVQFRSHRCPKYGNETFVHVPHTTRKAFSHGMFNS